MANKISPIGQTQEIEPGQVMKEWLSAREIAAERLPGLPTEKKNILNLAARENWDSHPYSRKRSGRGGGMEYRYLLLPIAAQIAYVQKYKIIGRVPEPSNTPRANAFDIEGDTKPLSDRARTERDARLAILSAFESFYLGFQVRGRAQVTALLLFSQRYNRRDVKVESWITDLVKRISPRSILRWKAAIKSNGIDRLGHDRSNAKLGKGLLENANGGNVKGHILGLIAHQPHLSANQIRTLCRAEFGDALIDASGVEVSMPPLRTFQHSLKAFKELHKVELLKLTNPDRFRSTMLPSGTNMLAHIQEPNALWQIDASPVDALCVDGRKSVYVCIDIATRRFITYVSDTPRASAVGLLIRKAILAWGVPLVIQTDNGSDFVAHDTKRLFAAIGIQADVSDAYSPAQKGHVERGIKTWQHQFASLLPGYVGHSVADRKAIEDRKSFADRLGQDTAEAFGVSLSGAELQRLSDEWCINVYAEQPHSGLKGETPAIVATRSLSRRTVNERALDVLLMPAASGNGTRRTTKFGVRIDGYHYRESWMMPGIDVFARMDPNDKGRAYIFSLDRGAYLGEAICPELAGIHPETFEKARKERNAELLKERVDPIKREIKRITKGPHLIEKVLEVARRDLPNVVPLPKRDEQHETPEIRAALDAGKPTPSRPLSEKQSLILDEVKADLEAASNTPPRNIQRLRNHETPGNRFARALDISHRLQVKEPVSYEEAEWLASYTSTAEYKARKMIHDDFGDQAPVLRP